MEITPLEILQRYHLKLKLKSYRVLKSSVPCKSYKRLWLIVEEFQKNKPGNQNQNMHERDEWNPRCDIYIWIEFLSFFNIIKQLVWISKKTAELLFIRLTIT